MTKTEAKPAVASVNALFSKSPDGLREIVRAVMQEMLEAEMTDALGAEKGERTAGRLGYRSGYYTRTLVTRVGKLELRVPASSQSPRHSGLKGCPAVLSRMIFLRRRPPGRRFPSTCRLGHRWKLCLAVQSAFSQRAAASALSSGRVLNAIAASGAALCTALITASNIDRLWGGRRMPAPITTQS